MLVSVPVVSVPHPFGLRLVTEPNRMSLRCEILGWVTVLVASATANRLHIHAISL